MSRRPENPLRGALNRMLQEVAQVAPGAQSARIALHRARGVKIGSNVWIGYDAVLETSHPEYITIEDNATIGIRAVLVAHFRETNGVRIERDVFIGPGVIVLPSVIGHGAVVTAGSVVTRSVAPMTVVQGNPAVPIARVGQPFAPDVTVKQFMRGLRRLDAAPGTPRKD